MKVSIITVIYNGVGFIEDNILSVKNQDYPDLEHIIIDGGSKDGTVDIIKKYEGSYNLRWVSEKDGGVFQAFNKGFRMATGDIYTWLDGDNYFKPGIVRKVVDIFQKGHWDIVHGDIEMVSAKGKHLGIYKAPEVSFRSALIKNTRAIPLQPAAFFTKELYQQAGEFDVRYRVAADHGFWLKVLRQNPRIFCYHEVLGSYRRGDATNSQSMRGLLGGYRDMLAIGDEFGQPWYGKLSLTVQYGLGLLSSLKKRIFS